MLTEKLLLYDLRRILRQLPGRLRIKVYGLFALIFVVAVFEVLSILSMTFTGMSVAAPQVLLNDKYVRWVLESLPALGKICEDPRYFTLFASLAVVFLTAIKDMFTALLFWQQSLIGEEMGIYVAKLIMFQYLYSPYTWHLGADSNHTLAALGSRQALSQYLVFILTIYCYVGTSIALVFILISATPGVILLVLGITAFVSYVVYHSMKKALDHSGEIAMVSTAEENRTRNNAMHGIREVLIYRQQPIFLQRFLEACRMGVRARAFLGMAPPIPTWVLEVYGFAFIPFTTWMLIKFYDADMALISGVVTMVMLASWRILPLLNRSLSSIVMLRSLRPMAMTCLDELEAIRKQPRHAIPEPDPNFRFMDTIVLKNACFRYPGAENLSQKNIQCSLKKGTQIGLVGLSGSGKSTLAAILAGLLELESGSFLIDGKILNDAELSAYRSKVGYVPQTPYLLQGNIAENVSFSQWGLPYDAERVKAVCQMAALDIVETDPRGIDYPLGENGSGLSGGQAQRVAIARALYASPEILILDESTSALDQQTESAIMETINQLKKSLTIIIIAHRLTTVEQCDWLIWMKDGAVYKQGPTRVILEEYRNSLTL